MTRVDPLPFRLGVTGSDTLGLDGARSVSYRMEGTLHLVDETVTIEWTGSKRTQHVDFGEVTDDVDHFPVEWLDVPVAWITSARLKGGVVGAPAHPPVGSHRRLRWGAHGEAGVTEAPSPSPRS